MLLLLALLACGAPVGPSVGDTDTDTPTQSVDSDTADGATERPLRDGAEDVIVHLFEWTWPDVARECEDVLGPAGFAAVQVSPPQEHAQLGGPWYDRYQPVSYTIDSRGGDRAAFADMVSRCADAGVDVIVDAILNHMAWGSGVGTAGTEYGDLTYPGHYGPEHFHTCDEGIDDWTSREEMQNCRLATLPDLATERADVRAQLIGYLQDLVDLGVAGFRLDAAKHVPAADLTVILANVEGNPYVFQEMLELGESAVIPASEYTHLGRVTEARYGAELSRVFRSDQLRWLQNFGPAWVMMPPDDALVFIENHDSQRGHAGGDPLTYKDGALYRLARVFMLAWPYGRPKLMSGYAFDSGDQGPPRVGDTEVVLPVHTATGDCADGWVCEHRDPAVLGMVGWRRVAGTWPVADWWDNGNDQIAFTRGDRAFLAMNREELSTMEETLQTGLQEGTYCDVLTGGLVDGACAGTSVDVDVFGFAQVVVGPVDALALHRDARVE